MLKRALTFTVLGALSCSLHAGTVMETVSRDLGTPAAAPTTITTHAQDGRLRIETQTGDSVMIFKDDVIYNVNKKDRSYVVMDRASMKRMADQLNPALKQMQEQLAQMPPEQRAQMEKMMGGRMAGMMKDEPQEIRKTARSGKASGHACSYVEVHQAGELTDELCVVPAHALKGSADLLASAKKMSALMKEMFSNLDAPWLKDMASKHADYEKIGGVPVLTRHFADGKAAHETALQSIRSEALAGSLFEVPAGFAKKEMMAR
jgi:hypothetical protein